MVKIPEDSISGGARASAPSRLRQRRRDFLIKTAGGALATGAFSAFPILSRAAESVNIGGLYPVTGSFAQIGQGCVAAAKLARAHPATYIVFDLLADFGRDFAITLERAGKRLFAQERIHRVLRRDGKLRKFVAQIFERELKPFRQLHGVVEGFRAVPE